MDASPADFKTVCGALLRRPGWVRFPSIPVKFREMTAKMSQEDIKIHGDAGLSDCHRAIVTMRRSAKTGRHYRWHLAVCRT